MGCLKNPPKGDIYSKPCLKVSRTQGVNIVTSQQQLSIDKWYNHVKYYVVCWKFETTLKAEITHSRNRPSFGEASSHLNKFAATATCLADKLIGLDWRYVPLFNRRVTIWYDILNARLTCVYLCFIGTSFTVWIVHQLHCYVDRLLSPKLSSDKPLSSCVVLPGRRLTKTHWRRLEQLGQGVKAGDIPKVIPPPFSTKKTCMVVRAW